MDPIPGSPLPNFSQKSPNSGLVWPHRCGSWKATYKKKSCKTQRGRSGGEDVNFKNIVMRTITRLFHLWKMQNSVRKCFDPTMITSSSGRFQWFHTTRASTNVWFEQFYGTKVSFSKGTDSYKSYNLPNFWYAWCPTHNPHLSFKSGYLKHSGLR